MAPDNVSYRWELTNASHSKALFSRPCRLRRVILSAGGTVPVITVHDDTDGSTGVKVTLKCPANDSRLFELNLPLVTGLYITWVSGVADIYVEVD